MQGDTVRESGITGDLHMESQNASGKDVLTTCRKSPVEAGLFLVDMVVLCQDLVQVKMRNFSQIQPANSSALMCALLYTRSNSSGDIKSQ